ncbi:MAG: YeeE/YedE thiosulfate transporter family protein [Comamonas sp.]
MADYTPVFTPLAALAGGGLIGAAAVLLLWLNGRIAGISGILGQGLALRGARAWPWLFLVGLVLGTVLYAALSLVLPLAPLAPRTGFPAWALVLAGLLVGYGTALGKGCTSGHGVCGLARLSPRSLAAVAVFLLAAIATTFVARHVWGGLA